MNKKVGRKTLLWQNLTHFYELCSIHGQSVIKTTIKRHNSKTYVDEDLTFAAGEQLEHELVLMALCSHELTFKTKFTVQILKKTYHNAAPVWVSSFESFEGTAKFHFLFTSILFVQLYSNWLPIPALAFDMDWMLIVTVYCLFCRIPLTV